MRSNPPRRLWRGWKLSTRCVIPVKSRPRGPRLVLVPVSVSVPLLAIPWVTLTRRWKMPRRRLRKKRIRTLHAVRYRMSPFRSGYSRISLWTTRMRRKRGKARVGLDWEVSGPSGGAVKPEEDDNNVVRIDYYWDFFTDGVPQGRREQGVFQTRYVMRYHHLGITVIVESLNKVQQTLSTFEST